MTPDESVTLMRVLDEANVPGRSTLDRVRTLIADRDRLYGQLEVKARTGTRERLLEMLDEDRSEVMMLLADEALDRGDEGEAKGWGWLAMAKKWPYRDRHSWVWSMNAPEAFSYALPESLVRRFGTGSFRRFGSRSEALLAVVDAIASGKWQPKENRQ